MDYKQARQLIEDLPRNEIGCWLWQGYVTEGGYGSVRVEGTRWQAHRLAYTLFVGPIYWPHRPTGEGLCVLHSCDNRLCCCPQHLTLGTRAQNMEEMYARGRQSTAEQRRTFGHRKLTEEQVDEIDKLYADGWTQEAIAPLFNVHQTAISKVLRRESWQHVRKS